MRETSSVPCTVSGPETYGTHRSPPPDSVSTLCHFSEPHARSWQRKCGWDSKAVSRGHGPAGAVCSRFPPCAAVHPLAGPAGPGLPSEGSGGGAVEM